MVVAALLLLAVLGLVGALSLPVGLSWTVVVLGLLLLVWGAVRVWPQALTPELADASSVERARLENDIRGSLVGGVTVATALLAAVLAWNQLAGARTDSLQARADAVQQQRATEQQLWIAGQQLNADAYNTAVSLLAGETVNQKTAGVLAVQRMGMQGARAQSEGRDVADYPLTSHAAIIMLTDYIASRAPLGAGWEPSTTPPSLRHDRADVQHALGAVSAITGYGVTLGARLRDVDLRGAELNRATLNGAWFDGSDLSYVDTSGGGVASFCGAHLTGTVLRSARLQDADLRGADLTRADLTDADLRGARLEGADLSAAVGLEHARLDGATYDETTVEHAPEVPWEQLGMVLTTDDAGCGDDAKG